MVHGSAISNSSGRRQSNLPQHLYLEVRTELSPEAIFSKSGSEGLVMETEVLQRIQELRIAGWSYAAIGREVEMSREQISSICKARGWDYS